MYIQEAYIGSQQLFVYKSKRSKEPHFAINGACIEDIDEQKVKEYLNEVDWTDRGSRVYIMPYLRCDGFLR